MHFLSSNMILDADVFVSDALSATTDGSSLEGTGTVLFMLQIRLNLLSSFFLPC